jgi:hypothetical protein
MRARSLAVTVLGSFWVAIGGLALASAPALAAAPVVERESFADVGSGSAELTAQVDPEGTLSEYHFEYATGAEYADGSKYGSTTPTASLGSGSEAISAPAQLTGLTPDTEYHFRVVVTNTGGETIQGGDMTFKTLPTGILGLPDGRVFERVTPVENENADVYVPAVFKFELPTSEGNGTEWPFQASVNGDAVAYAGDPTRGGGGVGGRGAGDEYLATRAAGGGWTQVDIHPPSIIGAERTEYDGFSADLSTWAVGDNSGNAELYDAGEDSFHALPANGYAGASADFSDLLLGEETGTLDEYSDGQLGAVNVLPDGSSAANATFGAPPLERTQELWNRPDFSHVVSANGSRVFWSTAEGDQPTGLYVREDPLSSDARTVLISENARFWTATADGSRVFFTKGGLYEYDLENGQTSDLTPGVEVEGVVGASENGEYIYYAASGYELELWHDGSSTPIAMLSQEDGWDAGPFHTAGGNYKPQGDWQAGLGDRTAEATPDGQSVVFMSNQSLQAVGFPDGYPNGGLYEVYMYEAQSGKLFCVSCNPSGEPPQSTEETRAGWQPSAAFLPISWSATYQPRWISAGGGRVFFDSAEPLVPQDTNGKQDVYEWERDGTGSCGEADGCLYLLSGGTGGAASWFLDADAEGENVFVISRTELVPGDPYDSFAVYDARVGGVQPPTPAQCSGTGCQGVPPAPPIFATPASVTFDGVGNFPPPSGTSVSGKGVAKAKSLTRAQKLASALKACRKKPMRKRAVCEAQARKRYPTKSSAKKAKKIGVKKSAKGRS